ncbi:hypothetical protein U0070_013259, partial [Myodes glareolus]
MTVKWMSVLLILQMGCYLRSGNCGKVLVWPMEYSHWLNLKTILNELVHRGHEVTVLRPSASILHDPQKSPDLKFESFPTSISKDDQDKLFTKAVDVWTNEIPRYLCLSFSSLLQNLFEEYSNSYLKICKDTVSNKQLMTKLQESKFDVLFSDTIAPCGEVIAQLLQIPFLYSLRVSPGYTMEKCLTRRNGVSFTMKHWHIIFHHLRKYVLYSNNNHSTFLLLTCSFLLQGRPTTLTETIGKAEMWLIRTYWDLEFPRPILPNVDYVGGLHCKPAKPLPNEGQHCHCFAFNTCPYVHNITRKVTNRKYPKLKEVEDVLGGAAAWENVDSTAEPCPKCEHPCAYSTQLLTRSADESMTTFYKCCNAQFEGKTPDTLGPNTRVYKWLPQNDLLDFVTHGGANGIYEAIHCGIPMIGIPLFGEQHDNIAYIVAKGAAVSVDFRTMKRADLLNALEAVIDNP